MFYTTPVLVFPSNTVIAQYKTYYEQNGYVTNIFINLSLGHISNTICSPKAGARAPGTRCPNRRVRHGQSLHGRRQQHEHNLRQHPTQDADPTISMEEIKHRVTRSSPRGSGYLPWSYRARSSLRQQTQLCKA